ncbi:MAG: glycosyltransferase [Caldilineales bacterium]|nr:glycosyltransferase [Caldilineales bacterium]
MTVDPPLVTIAIPVWNESELLPGLLRDLRAQTYADDRLQILILDGASTDGTLALAQDAARADSRIEVLNNHRRNAAAALNLALAQARGQYLVRLDARTRPAADYVQRCVDRLTEGRWAGVSGPQRATGDSQAGQTYALALNHPFGVGRPQYRRATQPVESETLYLGAYPVAQLRSIGGWDEEMQANEDYEMNMRLRRSGGRLFVDPAIRSDYLVRDNLLQLAQQYARYGAWRTVTWRRHPGAMRLRHAIPALFVLALALALLALPWSLWPLAMMALPYLLVDLIVSLQLGLRHRLSAIPRLLITFPAIHLAWGFSFWRALVRPPASPATANEPTRPA